MGEREGYETALQVAVEAAREAGAMLREEFLCNGGPRGGGDHAEIDEPAERVIHQRLTGAFPAWGYRGEEIAPSGTAQNDHLWLVDPNDGTKAFLQGYRGTAVSIALLRNSVPVLGVVYAFTAPDNRGDLFAWAEDCGLIRRNGVPVERQPFPSALTSGSIAVISQSADRAVAANLALTRPARYLTAPSIAYRLALVAVGEGDFACGLSGPGDWDYGAGHALLRAVGGELVDERREAVTYYPDRHTVVGSCFGGVPAVVGPLAQRNWGNALEPANKNDVQQYDLCRPVEGETIADDGLLGRVQGCWLGQLAGDALGSMVEFEDGSYLRARYSNGLRTIGPSPVWNTIAGQPTDDSEMALILARTLVRDGEYKEESVAAGYAYWLGSHPFDSGHTVRQAVRAMRNAPPGEIATRGRDAASMSSQANGALMRQSPLAIWGHALPPEQLDRIVRADTTLTHPHPACQEASAAFIVALAATIREGLDGEGAYERAVSWQRAQGTRDSVTEALEAARHSQPEYNGNTSGWVLVALQNAFYQALHAPSLEEGVVDTVMGGGDTDTNGAITGALLGAIHGARAIPSQWRKALMTCRPQEGAVRVEQPRPRAFWPVDAFTLSERLAVVGQRYAGTQH